MLISTIHDSRFTIHGAKRRKRPRTLFCILVCVAAVPVVQTRASVSGPDGTLYEFAPIALNKHLDHTFTLENRHGEPLTINKARPSCTCLHVLSYPHEIPAGGTGSFIVRMVPDNVGKVAYRLFVESSDPTAPVRVFTVTGTVLPAAKGRQHAAASTLEAVAPQFCTRVVTDRDESLYVTVAEVREVLQQEKDVLLVDVRTGVAFNWTHIKGAVNIRPLTLRTRRDLRRRKLVLVDEGVGTEWMEQDCRELRERGFGSVRIMRGGLTAWLADGGEVEGNAAGVLSVSHVSHVSAREFFYARKFGDWIVADASPRDDPRAAILLPERIHVPFTENKSEFTGRLASVVSGSDEFQRLLVFTADGWQYDAIRRVLPKFENVCVFFLADGLDEYGAYLAMLTAMQERRTQTSGGLRKPYRRVSGSCCGKAKK